MCERYPAYSRDSWALRDSDTASLGWGLRLCFRTKLPGDFDGPHATLGTARAYSTCFYHDDIEKGNLLPGDFQVEFDGAKVIDVHSHHLRSCCKQLFGLTGHTADQEMSC